MQLARGDRGLGILGDLLNIVRHVGVGRHGEHMAVEAAPAVFGFPGPVELGLDPGDVIGTPGIEDRGQLGLRPELDHLGILAEGELAAFAGDLHSAGESVCCMMTSAPWSISALAASASLPGSNQVLAQMILTLMFGLMVCAARIVALMPETTSGIGNEPI